MRFIAIPLLLLVFTKPVSAQPDVCTELSKALPAVKANFDTYTNYQFMTQGLQSAFLADFSFVSNTKTYIYKDRAKNENYFYQKLTDDLGTYDSWYRSFEKCLVKEKEKWTKLDGKDGKSVIFSCSPTGAQLILISGANGITVKIYRDKKFNIPVLANDFCQQIEKLANACTQGFAPVMGAYRDSGILGRSYKCTIQLNQRGTSPTIYVGKDFLNKDKTKYSLTEMFSYYEVSYTDLLSKIEQCLTAAKGWKKEKLTYTEGVQFIREEVSVAVRSEKGDNKDAFIEVATYTKF